jgi:glutamate/tyrosine decarboxylase-like PLP-dependent enzyme
MLSEKLLLTRYTYDKIRALPGFEVGPEPELSIFVFRYTAVDDPNAFNKRLLEALRADGTIFLSSTVLNGAYMIRFAILSYRTHLETVDLAVDVIRRTAQSLLV